MKNENSHNLHAFYLFSSCGEPLLVVPASSKEQAQERALDLLQVNAYERHLIAAQGVRVTAFSPAIVADGQILGYMPTAEGQFIPEGHQSGRHAAMTSRRPN